jgi:hypothetical protein
MITPNNKSSCFSDKDKSSSKHNNNNNNNNSNINNKLKTSHTLSNNTNNNTNKLNKSKNSNKENIMIQKNKNKRITKSIYEKKSMDKFIHIEKMFENKKEKSKINNYPQPFLNESLDYKTNELKKYSTEIQPLNNLLTSKISNQNNINNNCKRINKTKLVTESYANKLLDSIFNNYLGKKYT